MDTLSEKTLRKYKIFGAILVAIIIFFGGYIIHLNNRSSKNVSDIEQITTTEGKYQQFYYEREFKTLKKQNKELYDSLKKQKDYIKALEQFSYSKKYKVDTVFVERREPIPEAIAQLPDSTYEYSNETDSISYELKINSKLEPNWYALNVGVSDRFTIVSKDYKDGSQAVFVESSNQGTISNVTSWQKPTKRKWYQKFAIGPSITVGYDMINRNVGATIGISVTYDILKK